MEYALRMVVYVFGGGALLAWIHPRNGILEVVLIVALIGAFAGIDRLLSGAAASTGDSGSSRSRGRGRGGKGPFGARGPAEARGERRTLRLLHSTPDLGQAEALLERLRERKLHPMLVTQRGHAADDPIQYEVRLPESEWPRAHAVMLRFSAKSAES